MVPIMVWIKLGRGLCFITGILNLIDRAFLEPIKEKFNWISFADLWTLGGAVAIEAMDGPVIPWKSGRLDVDSKIAQTKPEKVIVDFKVRLLYNLTGIGHST
jgi:hypothetical protein